MRIILQGHGQVTIDAFWPGRGAPPSSDSSEPPSSPNQQAPSAEPTAHPNDAASPEERLFVGLLNQLQRHYERTGGKPTGRLLKAAIETLNELYERGDVPERTGQDVVFLAKLLAIVESLMEQVSHPFLRELAHGLRCLLLNTGSIVVSEVGEEDTPRITRSTNGSGEVQYEIDDESPADPESNGDDGGNGNAGGS